MKATKKIIAIIGIILGLIISNNQEANNIEIYIGAFMVIMAVAILLPSETHKS